MAVHSIYFPDLRPVPGGIVTISGDEAHHALRAKRISPGDTIRLCNGQGTIALARPKDSRKTREGWELDVDVTDIKQVPRTMPRLTVVAAAPKGDRLESMIDGLSQVDAAAWVPLVSERTIVEPREGKLGRLSRIAVEAMKQCGRAWMLEVMDTVPFEAAIRGAGGSRVIIANASGAAYEPRGTPEVVLVIGPEGGWTEPELAAARTANVEVVRFGSQVMRTETAAVVAAGIVMDRERAAS